MARRTPYVADGVLHVPGLRGGPEIKVGSASWAAWLTDPATHSFSFQSSSGKYTVRKEHRSRGGEYWVAYRKRRGKLHKAYLGKVEDVTLERLEEVAAALTEHGNEATASPPPDATAGDAGPARTDFTATKGSTTADEHVQERSHRAVHGDPLLLTKLSVPFVRPSLVARPGLSEKLDEGLGRKLTLLSAPAGFGKTTLLSTWIGEFSNDGRPIAWLSLDSGDNDPARFWRYFVTAIDQLKPGSGQTALALLGSPQAPPINAILTIVLNELGDLRAETVLVLDDYHLIETRAIHETLTFLIEHLPPRFHLVIATRADPPLPLSRLRARGESNELRAADLRFTSEEAAMFLNEVIGLELTAEDIAELEGRTEGWIAGLQLAALAMREHDDVPSFISSFTGSNRHVVDYLAEEVLGRQPEELRTFLLETSILDRMCAPLCNAVTGHTDGQTTLERLEHANLFVIPLDDERQWYRYHHLFADVLRQRLLQEQPDLAPEVHGRASDWFEQEGLLPEAVRHALAAGRWEHAADLIEDRGLSVMLSGQIYTVLGWMDALPDPLVRSRSTLCVIYAGAFVFTNRPDAAEAHLKRAEQLVVGEPLDEFSRLVLGQVAQFRAIIARFSGDLVRCVELARRALELLPETEMLFRSGARANVALAYQVSGDVAPANERPLEEAIAAFRASGALISLLNAINFLARLQRLQGRLRVAASTYRQTLQVVPGQQGLKSLAGSAAYYVGLGDIHREWNDLDDAEGLLTQGMDLMRGPLTIDADVATEGYLALALVYQALRRYSDALACLDTLENLARQNDFPPSLTTRAEAGRARLALARGDLQTAAHWAGTSGLNVDDEIDYLRHMEYLTLARVLIAQGREDSSGRLLDDALGLLDRLLRAAEDGGRMGSVIEILALRALVVHKRGDTSEALVVLERALTLAESESFVRTFVDEGDPMFTLLRKVPERRQNLRQHDLLLYVRRLLAAFDSPNTTAGPPPPVGHARVPTQPFIEPLTTREREVLELITEGLSNQEIAAQLFIATSTVKGYIHSIFRKLEVNSRTKAVARARELDFVSE
jgi:LuxR family maltose regulon positive regulatory protein